MMRLTGILTIALVVACQAGAEIEVTIAPDQPIPHVYVDDVLVLELRSEQDVEAHVRIVIRDQSGAEETALDETVGLRAQGIRWIPLENTAQQRGRYVAQVTIEAGGETRDSNHPFCRIDRPASMQAPPVGATLESADPYGLFAMRDLPLGKVCFRAEQPELDALVQAALQVGLGPAIFVDLNVTPADVAQALPEKYGSQAVHWGIRPGADLGAFNSVAGAFVNRQPLVPFSLIADSPEALEALLVAGAGRPASGLTYRHDAPSAEDLAAFDLAAQRAGYERMPLHVFGRGIAQDGPDAAARLMRNLLVFASCGVVQADIDGTLLFHEQDVTEGYVFLSALARRVTGAVAVGPMDVPAPMRALLFRIGDDWLITAWSEGEPGELKLTVGDAAILEFADASNNPLPPPGVQDGAVAVQAGPAPVYLSGTGGSVLASTARRMMQREAEAFMANDAYAALLPEEVAAIFEVIRQSEPPRIERAQFLALLPLFSLLEAKWHSGVAPQAVAVPAMRHLSDLIRHAAVVEQASGEDFVNPLQDTLATCAEFQQDYLMRADAPAETRERADWLLAEVTRLVAEAKQLEKVGRTIEANAVASLARWRARSLNATLEYTPPAPQPESAAANPEAEAAPEGETDKQ